MTGRDRAPDRVEPHAGARSLAWHELGAALVAVAVRQVELPAGDERGDAVRGNVAQAHGGEGERAVRGEHELEPRDAEQLDPLAQRLRGERERAPVLGALVTGEDPAAVEAGRLQAADRELGLVRDSRRQPAVRGQRERLCLDVGARPARLGDPAARQLVVEPGRERLGHPRPQAAARSRRRSRLPLSQRSHQRSDSCRKPIAGPGAACSGYVCAHGPISPFRGTSSPSSSAKTGFRYQSLHPETT